MTMTEIPSNHTQRALTGDVDAAIMAGMGLAKPRPLDDDGRFFAALIPAGATLHTIDVDELEEARAEHPHRKRGTVTVQDSGSFTAYIAKHGLAATEVWADEGRHSLVGVINAHSTTTDATDEGTAGHGDHRVALDLQPTNAWKAWVGKDKKWMGQQEFAEHIEDNVLDIVHPDAATMLEIAQSFHATTGVNFKSGSRLHSGEANLVYEETTAARAGEKGDLDIPTQFTLAVRPFWGQDNTVDVTARFRYRIRAGELSLSYALAQPDVLIHDIFADIVQSVDEQIEQPVFHGRPA